MVDLKSILVAFMRTEGVEWLSKWVHEYHVPNVKGEVDVVCRDCLLEGQDVLSSLGEIARSMASLEPDDSYLIVKTKYEKYGQICTINQHIFQWYFWNLFINLPNFTSANFLVIEIIRKPWVDAHDKNGSDGVGAHDDDYKDSDHVHAGLVVLERQATTADVVSAFHHQEA